MRTLTTLTAVALLFCACRKTLEPPPPSITDQVMCAPVTSDRAWYASGQSAPLFDDLGDLHFPVTTDDQLVQRYFNQGLILAYGFNHAEAARSFYHATRLDPDCAMAHWGYAYVLGPNYNAGMEPDHYERAYLAIREALRISKDRASNKERDLINALALRYVQEPIDDRIPLDVAYSRAMEVLFDKYSDDADIGTLYAESLMNLHPWDLYDKEGEAREWTPQIESVLERVIGFKPDHPGAHHFYIHAVESSATPERGLASARAFDDGLVPNAGHLVHMPSHIYIRTGDYHKGTVANIRAVEVDSNYVTACHAQGAYPLAYFPHNQHFLAATATLEGNSRWALHAADAVSLNANRQLMKEPGWGTIQHYYTIPLNVYVKFGKWNEILALENEVPELDYPKAVFHYARGMALLGTDDPAGAAEELKALAILASNEGLKDVTIWDINSAFELVQIAEKVLRARILTSEGDFDAAIALLSEAVSIEDGLNYNEPPDWFFSVRHHLGAVQLESQRYEEAANTYLNDLAILPENGWALKGLALAYEGLNDEEKQNDAENRFTRAWATADVALKTSVIY